MQIKIYFDMLDPKVQEKIRKELEDAGIKIDELNWDCFPMAVIPIEKENK